MTRRSRWWGWLSVTLALTLLVIDLAPWGQVATVGAATCVVTDPANSGTNTLRGKLAAAACDTITFQAGLGAVTLTSRIDVGRSVTIDGPGQVVQHGGGYAADGGLFWVTAGTVALRGLILQGGRTDGTSGGALTISGGSVTLEGATVRDNVAKNAGGGGGIYASNTTLRLVNTIVHDNFADNPVNNAARGGGGVRIDDGYGSVNVTIEGGSQILDNQVNGNNYGGGILLWRGVTSRTATLTLTNSTISGNTASGGHGLVILSGTATLTNTTISGNTGTGSGGGLRNDSGTVTLTNSTISGNSGVAGAGLYNLSGTMTLTNVSVIGNTASGNGGGLYSRGETGAPAVTRMRANVIAGNTGLACFFSLSASTQVFSQGYNVFSDDAYCPTGGSDLTYEGALDDLLNPVLADNGGPTQTHNLVADSPAINRIPTATCDVATDQRGFARPQPAGGNCDSGAVEYAVLVPLTVVTVGSGTVTRNPAGTGTGPFPYPSDATVLLTPQSGTGQTFIGWSVDGVAKGWAPSLTLTMNAAHTVQATFAPVTTFGDVGNSRPDYDAIVALATRGTIRGYANGHYGPDDGVQRAQMAALIARAMTAGPGNAPVTLSPPACLVAGSWDCEEWGNNFSDRNGLDANLWRNIGTLQNRNVARGYDGAACAARGVPSPCFAPTAPVSYVETVTFITRAMVAKGYWVMQPNAPQPYAGVPAVFVPEVATYTYYTGGAGGVPAPPANWNAGATRGWFARVLWQALNTYWGTEGNLPDGRPAGGNVP